MYEGHPVSEMWTLDDDHYELDPDYGGYFDDKLVESEGWPDTYIGDLGKTAEDHAKKYEKVWRLDQIVNTVLNSGLRLVNIGEHPDLYWDRFPNMDPDLVRRLPQTFSLLAEKLA
jgi:hypothetical protein